jgi:alanine-glyoxylate transaminase/serine-glyoxylate transaminase/serine-pyruvate transaminase
VTLRFGREALSIPGPSVFPDRVLQAMQRPAPNIYEGEIVELTDTLHHDLKRVARTDGDSAIYVANGHGAWEVALANTLSPGDTVLVLASGIFATNWGRMGEAMGIKVETLDAGFRGAVDPVAVGARLAEDTSHTIRAVLVVQIDTASSVWNDLEAIGDAIRASGHPALFMVDCIASLGSVPYEMDAWGADVTVAACQKGLMTPPGISFNFIGPRAWEARDRLDRVPSHWDWDLRCRSDIYYLQFGGTPPTHHLYALREALDILLDEEGLETAWRRHGILARAVRACVGQWTLGGPLEFNILDEAHRSDAVTTLLTNGVDATALRAHARDEYGLVLGLSIGMEQAGFRIGHMGHLNPPMLLGTLAATEASMRSLGIDHHSGIEAAIAQIAAAS